MRKRQFSKQRLKEIQERSERLRKLFKKSKGILMMEWIKDRLKKIEGRKKMVNISKSILKEISIFLWPPEKWHHICLVRDKAEGDILYVDGQLRRTSCKGVDLFPIGMFNDNMTFTFWLKSSGKSFDPKRWGMAQQIAFAHHFRKVS